MANFPGTPTAPPPPRFQRRPRWPEAFEQQEAARDAIDLATFRRIYDETMDAALLSARDAPDPESAGKIFNQASSRVSSIESTRPGVQQAYARFYEGAQARYRDAFARQAAAIKDKRTHDQGVLNYQAAIESGKPLEAATALEHLKIREPENIALYERQGADIPFDISFTSASKQINSGDPVEIRRGVEALQSMPKKGWRKEQVAAWNQLVKAGQAELESRQNDNYKALHEPIFEMDAAATDLEFYKARDKAAKAIEDAEASGAINAQQALALRDHWRTHQKGEAKPDPRVEAQGWTMIQDPAQDRAVVDAWLWDHATELGTRLPDLVKANAIERNEREDYDSQAAVSVAVARFEMDSNDEAAFRRMEFYELNGKGFTAEEKHARAMADAVTFMTARPPKPPEPPTGPFTELRKQQVLGALISGGSRIDSETGETIPWSGTRELYDYLLGPKGLGPEWYLVSPRTLRVVLRRAPLAFWHFQSDKEKAATLDRVRKLKQAFWDGTVLEADITEGDREVAVETAPSGPITPSQVRAFEDYLDDTGTPFPKPASPPPAEVLSSLGEPLGEPPGGEAPVAARLTLGGFPVVETDADYDALPFGTVFVGPDGVKRRKP